MLRKAIKDLFSGKKEAAVSPGTLKETKEEAARFLNDCSRKDRSDIFDAILRILPCNADFEVASIESSRQELDIFCEDKVVHWILQDTTCILSEEEQEFYREIRKEGARHYSDKKKTQLLLVFLTSDALVEGFFLASPARATELYGIARAMGCPGRFAQIEKDPVYQRRRAWMCEVAAYARAAVGLWGAVAGSDFMEMLDYYGVIPENANDYCRQEGTYRQSIMASPRGVNPFIMKWICGKCVPEILESIDGLLLHACFAKDVAKENQEFISLFGDSKSVLTQNQLDSWYAKLDKTTNFRLLYRSTEGIPFYLPDQEEVLRYADDPFGTPTQADLSLQSFLLENCEEEMRSAAWKKGEHFPEFVQQTVRLFHEKATDIGTGNRPEKDAYVAFVLETLSLGGLPDENAGQEEITRYALAIYDQVPLWSRHGFCSADWIGKTNTLHKKNDRQKMSRRNECRIYPNDPCPCGSGKKYKKCCGRGKA